MRGAGRAMMAYLHDLCGQRGSVQRFVENTALKPRPGIRAQQHRESPVCKTQHHRVLIRVDTLAARDGW